MKQIGYILIPKDGDTSTVLVLGRFRTRSAALDSRRFEFIATTSRAMRAIPIAKGKSNDF